MKKCSEIKRVGALRGRRRVDCEKMCEIKRGRWRVECEKMCEIKRLGSGGGWSAKKCAKLRRLGH